MILPITNLKLYICSIDDILTCVNLASLLEFSAWPKPGNVHRTKDFKSTRYEHFLAGASAIVPAFKTLCDRIYYDFDEKAESYDFVGLGDFYLDAANRMINWQKGGNVILGHILVLGALAASATLTFLKRQHNFESFRSNLIQTVKDSKYDDTIKLYKAIRFINPSWTGKVVEYDINDENSFNKIESNNVNLETIFQLFQDIDMIAFEYANGFPIILNEGVPYFLDLYRKCNDINIAIVNTFLKILADHPDTLIIRKSGLDAAKTVSERAKTILDEGGLLTSMGKQMVFNFDEDLQSKKGKLNPGTTADLLAGVIFVALIFGIKF